MSMELWQKCSTGFTVCIFRHPSTYTAPHARLQQESENVELFYVFDSLNFLHRARDSMSMTLAPQIFQFSYRSRAFRCLRRCSARLDGEISLSLSRLENKSRSGLISVRALMGKQEKREKFHSTWRRAALTSWKNVTLCHKNSLFISQLFAIVEVVR